MGVEEERDPRRHLVDRQPGRYAGLQVGDPVGQGEGHLLDSVRSRLADVVAADADAVPARQLVPAEGQDVRGQPHRGRGRIDVRSARDVLLEDVVLDGARERRARDAALVRHRHVEREQDGGGGVDGHRGRDPLERQALEQHAACPAGCRWPRRCAPPRRAPADGRSRGPSGSGRSNATDSPVCPEASSRLKRWLVASADPKPAYWRMVQSRPRCMVGWIPRVNGGTPGRPRSRSASKGRLEPRQRRRRRKIREGNARRRSPRGRPPAPGRAPASSLGRTWDCRRPRYYDGT